MSFIVAYDVSDPRRLRKAGRYLERYALRTQKSVFLYDGTYASLRAVLSGMLDIIDIHMDRVQAWPVLETAAVRNIDIGALLPPKAICVIAGRATTLVLEQKV